MLKRQTNLYRFLLVSFIVSISSFSNTYGIPNSDLKKEAITSYENRNYSTAFKQFRKVMEKDPQDIFSKCLIICCQIEMRRLEEASKATAELLQSYPSSSSAARGVIGIADHYKNSGYFGEAIEIYKYAIDNYPEYPELEWPHSQLACTYIQTGQFGIASKITESLKKHHGSKTDMALTQIADYLKQAGHSEQAIDLYKHVIDNYPQSSQATWGHSQLACIYIESKNFNNGQKMLEDLLKRPRSSMSDISILQIAQYYGASDYYDKAIEIYKYFIDKFPESPQQINAQSELICCYLFQNMREEISLALDNLLEEFNSHPTLYSEIYKIGQHCIATRNYAIGLGLYQQMLDYPQSVENLLELKFKLMLCYMGIGMDNDAQEVVDDILRHHYLDSDFVNTIGITIKYQEGRENTIPSFIYDQLESWAASGDISQRQKAVEIAIKNYNMKSVEKLLETTANSLSDSESDINDLQELINVCNTNGRYNLASYLCEAYLNNKHSLEIDSRDRILLKDINSKISLGRNVDSVLKSLDNYIDKSANEEIRSEATFLKGRALVSLGEAEEATEVLASLIKTYPNYERMGDALYTLAYCKLLSNRLQEAEELFSELIAKYPESQYSTKSMEYIQRIKHITQ